MSTVHVIPERDTITHPHDGTDCPCQPTQEPVPRPDGTYGWLTIHHALDGRPEPESSRIRTLLIQVAVRVLGAHRAPRHWACYWEEAS